MKVSVRITLGVAVALASSMPLDARADGNPFGWHEHDGFYLRLGIGAGLVNIERSTEQSGQGSSPLFIGDSSSIRSFAPGLELSVGATVFDGFTLAASVLEYEMLTSDIRLTDGTHVELDKTLGVTVVALTTDVFPDPAGGVHVGGGVGYADTSRSVATTPGGIGGDGYALTAFGGYGFWFGDDWSVGGMLRGTVAFVSGEHESGGLTASEDDVLAMISLLATVLYH